MNDPHNQYIFRCIHGGASNSCLELTVFFSPGRPAADCEQTPLTLLTLAISLWRNLQQSDAVGVYDVVDRSPVHVETYAILFPLVDGWGQGGRGSFVGLLWGCGASMPSARGG